MQLARLSINAVLLMALLTAGCRLPGREGPISQSLTDCRRLSQQGAVALERGDATKAEGLLSKAVAACPVDAEARRYYAESLWRRGAHDEAIAQLEAASQLSAEDASLWARLAEMRLAQGQYEVAQRDADQALRLDPKLAKAWAIHGGVAKAGGRFQDALTDNLRALSYTPNDRAILLEIAELHRQLNRPDRALQALQSLADTYSPGEEPSQVLYLTGLAYVALARYDDGVESLAAAVTRGQPSPEMLCHLGEAQLLAGRPLDAANAANQALAMQPQHQASRELLERVQLAQQSQGAIRR